MAFKRRKRTKKCKLCSMKTKYIDYKDLTLLSDYVNEKGKIMPKRINGNCSKHQRVLRQAIHRARHVMLLPYTND
ncbi:30S ribosomal protein S18 [Oceanotoga sp. DSM 15011]|jgi:small subunit ribosomal protein S18|uniref:Small ribosomal subunit protein bS18 n=1 Tax=Oceanotoga teriensis TaxID=515440 RepID=A0AA45C922_9BACT|nr:MULTISPECIES: 30S ribosomal protein S18 [Oceanotoga]MDN5341619.1 small subunit ribosomal protein [Oceanotoga sp.]MDO7977178.1 30S ribosomal protein S18 [Oceanotoga teriensis]PWJ96551.1 SSU ribosomal protein S18P [Oceanotoga teriensis]UYP00275.1 30S ribosomal protein S18 [Oceanotoga sp. DSM 15011]